MESIVRECIAAKCRPDKRKEALWLNERYQQFMRVNRIERKSEADQILADRIFGNQGSATSSQKIRYWRRGLHMPGDRETARRLAFALEMTEQEVCFLLQGWLDRSDQVYAEDSAADPVYKQRLAVMENLTEEYILKLCLWHLEEEVTEETVRRGLRHYYYVDSLRLLAEGSDTEESALRHYDSVYYNSEFRRNLKLLGEIPRRTMLRHIFVMGMPYLSRDIVSELLVGMGYLPLQEDHCSIQGDALDLLILRLLERYEEDCRGRSPAFCRNWLTQALQKLDHSLAEAGEEGLRFLKFKSQQREKK